MRCGLRRNPQLLYHLINSRLMLPSCGLRRNTQLLYHSQSDLNGSNNASILARDGNMRRDALPERDT